ncbi:MAG: thioesterase family protein [Pseudomonadota bacterium]
MPMPPVFDNSALTPLPATKSPSQDEKWLGETWSRTPGYVGTVTATAAHIDGFGHVNNMVYPLWAMEAAWHHSAALGFPFERFQTMGTGFVISTHEFSYKVPVLKGQTVHVATWIARNDGRLRLTRAFEMRLADCGTLVFTGETLFISIDMQTGKPIRMPRAFAQAYAVADRQA